MENFYIDYELRKYLSNENNISNGELLRIIAFLKDKIDRLELEVRDLKYEYEKNKESVKEK